MPAHTHNARMPAPTHNARWYALVVLIGTVAAAVIYALARYQSERV